MLPGEAEGDEKNIGSKVDPVEFSARWLFRHLYSTNQTTTQVWIYWATMEMIEDNLGLIDGSEFGSASWIAKDIPVNNDYAFLYVNAIFQYKLQNFGHFEDPDAHSSRYFFRERYRKTGALSIQWAKMEYMSPEAQLGEDRLYSAQWIFNEQKRLHRMDVETLDEWIRSAKI